MNKINEWLKKKSQPYLTYTNFISEVNRMEFHQFSEEALREAISCYHDAASYDQRDQIRIFALIKEIVFRLTGLKLFDSQLAASVSLMNGKIAELPTGEGKTLAAVIPALIHAMQGLHVHVLTFNDYLAERDYNSTRSIYEFCGVSVGFVTQAMLPPERAGMYLRNIVYVTAKEAGFDYLKNFLCTDESDVISFPFHYAIVDEADSILIDEARNPLVIACDHPRDYGWITKIGHIVDGLGSDDFVILQEENQVYLTEQGIGQVERSLHVGNLYTEQNIELLSMVNMALQAKFLLKRDLDYIVKDNHIRIVDETTGRTAMGKKYPDLLHASIEVKEGLSLSRSSMIYNMMTIQSFLLLYRKLSGMTGTAITSKNEFYRVYGLAVDVIPPHTPSRRIDHEPLLFPSKSEKYQAVIEAIVSANEKGQPVLIGTQSVEESEKLSSMLDRRSIPHQILNAKNDREEAALIAGAGKRSTVTVSTNMAGRGVDIKLGGADETGSKEVREAGGLFVIGTALNRSVRIDHQLCGRAGRQGDIGESSLFSSLEDELFESVPWLSGIASKEITGIRQGSTSRYIVRVQQHVEGVDESSRLILSRYSCIIEHQRQIITDYRNRTLTGNRSLGGLELAKKQLTLYYINHHWAEYLESMEYIRDGIHLTIIGGLDPLEEYHKIAVSAFDEILKDIEADVIGGLTTYEITENGIDMEAAGLGNATTTWTYLIDESKSQFSSLPRIMNGISNQMKGTLFSLSKALIRLRCKK